MNENDSREAHEQRDKDVASIAQNTVKSPGVLRAMLQSAWESGFDCRAADARIAAAAREYVEAERAAHDPNATIAQLDRQIAAKLALVAAVEGKP